MINKSKISDQLTVILTDGITFAGLNILDINKLNRETGIPVIAVMDRMPNLKKIENLFHSKHIDDRIEIMKSAGITISKSPADIGKTLFDKLKG